MSSAIAIVGGSYGEDCSFPRRQMFRGSGGRAAAVLSSLGTKVCLHTVLGKGLANEFSAVAKLFGYELAATSSSLDIWFRYRFPLGRPDIYPAGGIAAVSQPPVEAESALVFGMIEGRPVVHARRVVYDPQDGKDAKHYSSNGSTADELALVVSLSEGRALTGCQDPEAVAAALLGQRGVSVAIVKCGPQGALVRTSKDSAWVYSFPTTNVYKIGSGDVFSATFAHGWLVNGMPAIDAAWLASRITAHYVESSDDRIDSAVEGDFQVQARAAHLKAGQGRRRLIPDDRRVYLAGPFFNAGQQWAIDEARGALRDMGFKVFSPIHDVGEGLAGDVATDDLKALEESSVVLALLDGLDPGTLFEVGYARGKSIPVIAVAEAVPESALTMVFGSDCYVTNDLTTGIYATCWRLMGDA
ncbi:PfkB family carbohydrate kinase [Paraburkholderia fungorum]|uniref:PfkB family carbohydrate kinase n=1 Tax=Paraburkholderia fungorum TaxID=134537 RepID=UPI0038BADABB